MKINKHSINKKKLIIVSFSVILGLSVILYGGFRWWLRNKVSRVKTVTSEDIKKLGHDSSDDEEDSGTTSPEDLINKANATIDANTNNGFNGELQDPNVMNIMVVGSDTRDSDKIGLTDVMILVSINKVSKQVYLTSFMRDTYVAIPEHSNNRLNTAFNKGSDTFFETMKKNFNIKIDKFVYINFYSFMEVIDEIGGITVDVTEAERTAMNQTFSEINRYLDDPEHSGEITKTGSQTLSGKQVLAWTRIRKKAGNDFKRTERQRIVLEKVLEKVKTMNIFKLNEFADTVLPKVMTNMTYGEIESMLLNAFSYISYDIVQQRVPADGTYEPVKIGSALMMSIDFEENIKLLGRTIYKKDYPDATASPSSSTSPSPSSSASPSSAGH